MRRGEATLLAVDGVELWHQWWLPGDGGRAPAPKAVVMLVHGLGEHSGRYEHVAAALVDAGYAVRALDHRGHGRSDGPRAFVRRYSELLDDLDRFGDLVEREHPGLPVVVLGHSMGGNLAIWYVLGRPQRVAALALSAPALAPGRSVSTLEIRAAKVLARWAPRLRPAGLDATAISRDPGVVARYRNDPLVYSGRLTTGIAGALLGSMDRLPARYAELRLPILIMHGTADALADVVGSRRLEAGATQATVTAHYYDGWYHEVFNEPERATALADLIAWLDEWFGERVSAANPRAR